MAIWSCLKSCGVCCACLSIWAIVQLSLMGLFYYWETPILIEDVEAHHATSFEDFIKQTRKNYRQNAYNCWAVAGIYGGTFLMSITFVVVSNKKMASAETKRRNEDLVCGISTSPPIPSAKGADKAITTSTKPSAKGADKGKDKKAAVPPPPKPKQPHRDKGKKK